MTRTYVRIHTRPPQNLKLEGWESVRTYTDSVSNTRYFCGNCGSPLYITNPDHANVIIVTSGTLNDAPEMRPNVEFHCKRRAG